ncbi:hypothetical protein SSX86_000626 [Deinandra increscens subsp. villosa]|uniref:Uncharacterized protein n=1 Tax=Deinandra increscens subsp. villosa TaxID=3103831 RepID=A0AAP0HBU9_9ASTR
MRHSDKGTCLTDSDGFKRQGINSHEIQIRETKFCNLTESDSVSRKKRYRSSFHQKPKGGTSNQMSGKIMGDPTPLDSEAIHSRIKQLTEIRSHCHDDAYLVASDEDDLITQCVLQLVGKLTQVIEEYSDVSSLQPEDLDIYLDNLKAELCSVEAENAKLSNEVESLTKGYLEDSIRFQMGIDGLNSSVEFIQSQGLETKRGEHQPESEGVHCNCKFKISELNSQLEKKEVMLKSLENLDYTLKRFEGFLKIEDTCTGLEVIEYDGNRISLSLRTYVPEIEMAEQNHELAIELLDDSLELKKAEIFPNDVYIGEIIDAAKSFVHQFSLPPAFEKETSLEWFVRRVQDKIVLSTLRKSLVKAASKSRHSIEYVDKDEIIVAHMLDGVDAYIKVSQGWPIASSPLKLLSLKGSSQSSKEVTLSFLCKVELAKSWYFQERVNSLDEQVCQNLSTFMDATEEIFKQIMRTEIQSNSNVNK